MATSDLLPFFTYYGGKWRTAPRYPEPRHHIIVEPFAGAAGYATRYADRKVILVEKNPQIAEVWRYLIQAKPSDILNLPDIPSDGSVDDVQAPSGARALIGLWLNKGAASPCKRPSSWMRSGIRPRSYWGPEIRARIASQVERIRHWEVIEGDYTDAPDIVATWFIDPPYQGAGKLYPCGANQIDYAELAKWCRSRRGDVLVCENEGAVWLPFVPFMVAKSTPGARGKGKTREALWVHISPSGERSML